MCNYLGPYSTPLAKLLLAFVPGLPCVWLFNRGLALGRQLTQYVQFWLLSIVIIQQGHGVSGLQL